MARGEAYEILPALASADANAGKISYASPLAKNLIGKFEGDTFKLETPSGFTEYEIEKVEYL